MNYCEKCGAKIDKNTKFCPECGTKINTITNQTKNTHNTIFTAKNIVIVFLVIIILGIIMVAPTIMEYMAPYTEVDSSYIANHVADEKVQFDGEYIGTLSTDFYSRIGPDFDYIFKVGDEYVFVHGSYSILSGNEGKTFHLEGKFPDGPQGEKSNQLMDGERISGYWFKEDYIEIAE